MFIIYTTRLSLMAAAVTHQGEPVLVVSWEEMERRKDETVLTVCLEEMERDDAALSNGDQVRAFVCVFVVHLMFKQPSWSFV